MTNTRKYILLIVLLILAVYSNSFQNEFVWDDQFLIVDNPSVMSWKYTWIHFALDLYRSFSNYYRPIQMLTYMVDFSIWRLDPFGYHLTNVILHIFVSFSMFTLFKLMTGNDRVAFAGTLFYAVHPAHTAAVTYISGRADPLAALFTFLSLIFFHFHFKTQNRVSSVFLYVASIVFFLLGLLSKEIVIVLPALLLCYRLFFIKDEEVEKSRRLIKFHYLSWFVIILGVYLILRSYALNFLDEGFIIIGPSLYSRLLTSVKTFALYLGIVFFPFLLHMERQVPYANSFFDGDVLLPLMLFLLIVWLGIRVRRISKVATFGLIFFFISLLPIMNIYPLPNNMAEHWLYAPLAGISIFICTLGGMLAEKKRALRIFLLALFSCCIIFFSYRTFDRNFDWRDKYTIYTHTLFYSPKSIKILNNLGNYYHENGDFEMAVVYHKKAVEINPKEHRSRLNVGADYESMGLIDEAVAQYKLSTRLNPNYAKAFYKLGNIYIKKGDFDLAIQAYKRAIGCDELFAAAHNQLGNVYFIKGYLKKARQEYEKAIESNPYIPEVHNNLGSAFAKLGLYNEAIEEYEEAIDLSPDEAEYHKNLGTAYGWLSMYDNALEELKVAHELNPRDIETLLNLGAAYYYRGDSDLAEKEWSKVLRIDPENTVAKEYLKMMLE